METDDAVPSGSRRARPPVFAGVFVISAAASGFVLVLWSLVMGFAAVDSGMSPLDSAVTRLGLPVGLLAAMAFSASSAFLAQTVMGGNPAARGRSVLRAYRIAFLGSIGWFVGLWFGMVQVAGGSASGAASVWCAGGAAVLGVIAGARWGAALGEGDR